MLSTSDSLWSDYLEAWSMPGITYPQYFGKKIVYKYVEDEIEKNMLF